MRRGQTTLEFLMILGVAMLILLVTITISNDQSGSINVRKAELQASLAASDIATAAREVYAQGSGARKIAFVTFPRSYSASLSSINSTSFNIHAGRSDYVQTFPFQISGTFPTRPGSFEFLIENEQGVINIGRWLAYANLSSIGASINGGDNYSESISLSSLSSSSANVTVQCVWEDSDVAISCPNSTFVLDSQSESAVNVSFSSGSDTYGVFSGVLNISVSGLGGNQTIEIPISLYVNDVFNSLSNRIAFLPPTPSNGFSTTLAQLGASPAVINATVQNMSLSELRFKLGTTDYKYFDNSLVAMYNFDSVAALGETEGTVADLSNYHNNASVYDSVRLMLHMDEADGNTSFDGSAYKNNGAIFGNSKLVLHMDENTGGTAFDESAYKNNGTCVGMASINGANACNWVSGKNGSGIAFDGVNDRIDVPAVAITASGTVEGWIYANDLNSKQVFGQGTAAITKFGVDLGTTGLGMFVNEIGIVGARTNQPLATKTWYHFAAVHDSTTNTQKMYLDGVLQTITGSQTLSTGSDRMMIGYNTYAGGSQYFNGTIDEFAVYS
ncbi:MAG: LamG domain-containing protein, partial [Candidatus Micrarchaeia archaeon]